MPSLKPYEDDHDVFLWKYVPSIAASGIFGGCFALLAFLVMGRMVMTRTWFAIPFIIGGIFETVGYLDRIWAAYNTDKLTPYTIQAILILIAPAVFAASVYMVLGRLIRSVDAEHHSIIRTRFLTKIFVITDILSFLVQATGSGMEANQHANQNLAKAVVLVGLAIQVIGFGLFIISTIVFHKRILRKPTPASEHPRATWKRIIYMLYAVNSFILLRSIFRIVEFTMGINAYLFAHEWPLLVFDGALMLLSMSCFVVFYPKGLDVRFKIDNEPSDVSYHPVSSQIHLAGLH